MPVDPEYVFANKRKNITLLENITQSRRYCNKTGHPTYAYLYCFM